MKKLYLVSILFLVTFNSDAQISWNWVNSLSGSNVQIAGTRVTSDAAGNVYTAGSFDGTRPFGTYMLTAMSTSGTDAYVAKYDVSGNCVWAINVGYSNSTTTGNNVCVDLNGDIYVCGSFTNTLQINSNYYFASGQNDNFLLKLDPTGNIIRVKISGGQSADEPRALTVDAQNNIYMAGAFGYKAFFDSDSVMTAGLSSLTDIFMVKYDSSGNFVWVRKAGGTDADAAFAIHYRNNRLYLAGVIIGQCTFGSNSVNAAATDAFIAKYDLAGNNLWVKQGGGTANDFCYDMSTDSFGNAYLTGSIILNATFGTLPTLSAGNFPNVFIAKIDSAGIFQYAKKAGTPNLADFGSGIATDDFGYSVITGSFNGTISFSPFNLTSTGTGTTDAFVVKYNPSGICQYALKGGGIGNDGGSGITWVASQNEYVAVGNYQNSATFGTYNLSCPGGAIYASYITRFPGYFTGIENFQSYEHGIVYPNPSNDFVHIKVADLEDAERLILLNSYGQVVMNKIINDNQSDLIVDVSKLSSGIYTAKINSANTFTTCKVQVIK